MKIVALALWTVVLMMRPAFSLNGFLPVYKPTLWTSNDVVQKVKRVLKTAYPSEKLRVGHGGTLDPMAEGLLVIGIGHATKGLESYLKGSKIYKARASFGSSTDTLDATGVVTSTMDSSFISHDMILRAIPSYIGTIEQIPPMYSALRTNGIRLYDLARQGIEVERKPRSVTVHRISIVNHSLPKWADFEIECGGGFYVRSFIDSLGKSVHSRAHMSSLVRQKQGNFSIERSIHPNDFSIDLIKKHIIELDTQ